MTALPGLATVTRTADVSPCGLFRYRLGRTWDPARPVLGFVMLNPSTADADQDDPTIRRCVGFARREGCGGIDVANLYAFRATDPSALVEPLDVTGPGNVDALEALFAGCSSVVAAWGPKYRETLRRRRNLHGVLGHPVGCPDAQIMVRAMAGRCGIDLVCLGVTKDRSPRHPLMVRADQPLESWTGGGL